VQQITRKHGHWQRDEKVLKIDDNPFCQRHVRELVYDQIDNEGDHKQKKNGKKNREKTPVPTVHTGHDGRNAKSNRCQCQHGAAQ
jgi:hypothetical protein